MVRKSEVEEGEDGVDVRKKDVCLAARLETASDADVRLKNAFAKNVDVVDEIEVALRKRSVLRTT